MSSVGVFDDPATLPALSVRQPWAGLISLGIKRIEVRSRRIHHRGDIVIGATATVDEADFEALRKDLAPRVVAAKVFDRACTPTSVLCAVVNVTGCRPLVVGDSAESMWWDEARASRMFGWLLAAPRPLAPVPFRGSQGWQRLDRAAVQAALAHGGAP